MILLGVNQTYMLEILFSDPLAFVADGTVGESRVI